MRVFISALASCLAMILGASSLCYAYGKDIPFHLVVMSIRSVDSSARTAVLAITGVADAGGRGTIMPVATDRALEAGCRISSSASNSFHAGQGDTINMTWNIVLPGDGSFRLADLTVSYDSMATADRNEYDTLFVTCIYARVMNGVAVYSGKVPTIAMTRLTAMAEPSTQKRNDGRQVASATVINVSIRGQVWCEPQSGYSHYKHGVPGLEVFIDWDLDSNLDTKWHPPYDDEAVEWAVTDDEGNYVFNRRVIANPGDPVWNVKRIVVRAQASNVAGQDLNLGAEAVFLEAQPYDISISPSSPTVNAIIDLAKVDNRYGNTLRYLLRARSFCINTFGKFPPAIDFHMDQPMTLFRNYLFASPTMNINGTPNSYDCYHEYGHYVQYLYGDRNPMGQCPTKIAHSWPTINNDQCAFTEGWANAYCAMAHGYYYRHDMPAAREDDRSGNNIEAAYQFPDYGQLLFENNNADLEGATSCFIYDLWDDIRARAPGYSGDNEDLGYPFGYKDGMLLDALRDVTHPRQKFQGLFVTWVRDVPALRSYRDNFINLARAMYPITAKYHDESIRALYDAFTAHASAQTSSRAYHRSATPTSITITTSDPKNYRILQWDNPVEPVAINYAPESVGLISINLVENNPDGYVIWRKNISNPAVAWDGRDGRLDAGYQRVGTVGANPRLFADATVLAPGTYSYVVVAYNQPDPNDLALRLSIPKAEKRIIIPDKNQIRLKDDIACGAIAVIQPGHSVQYSASTSDSTVTSYTWIAANKPPYLALSGINTTTLTITNTYTSGGPVQTGLPLFTIRCIASGPSGADTSGVAVATLADGFLKKGRYVAHADLSRLPAGVYLYRLSAGSWTSAKNLVVIR